MRGGGQPPSSLIDPGVPHVVELDRKRGQRFTMTKPSPMHLSDTFINCSRGEQLLPDTAQGRLVTDFLRHSALYLGGRQHVPQRAHLKEPH